jgi:hypothetical protein
VGSEVQILLGPPHALSREGNGALAQLGERLLCKHQVIGSIPIGSTTLYAFRREHTLRFGADHILQDVGNQFAVAHVASAITGPLAYGQWFVFDIVNGFFERCRGNGIGDHSFNTSREQGQCAWKQKKSFDSRMQLR